MDTALIQSLLEVFFFQFLLNKNCTYKVDGPFLHLLQVI